MLCIVCRGSVESVGALYPQAPRRASPPCIRITVTRGPAKYTPALCTIPLSLSASLYVYLFVFCVGRRYGECTIYSAISLCGYAHICIYDIAYNLALSVLVLLHTTAARFVYCVALTVLPQLLTVSMIVAV